MVINLHGKTAIVSGSTTGIGYAIAKVLAQSGASVVMNGRSEDRLQDAMHRLRLEVPDADVRGLAADLSGAEGVSRLVTFCPHTDILVNNIGIFEPKPFFEITDEDWDLYYRVNVMTAVRLSRYYAEGMCAQKWGRILFNASVTSGFLPGEMVHYGATKAALLGLSRGLAEAVSGTGVTVNAVIPGPTRTEKTNEFLERTFAASGKSFEAGEAETFGSILPSSLVKRFLTPEEIANLFVFLASDQASAITGAAYRVDGGIVRSLV